MYYINETNPRWILKIILQDIISSYILINGVINICVVKWVTLRHKYQCLILKNAYHSLGIFIFCIKQLLQVQ